MFLLGAYYGLAVFVDCTRSALPLRCICMQIAFCRSDNWCFSNRHITDWRGVGAGSTSGSAFYTISPEASCHAPPWIVYNKNIGKGYRLHGYNDKVDKHKHETSLTETAQDPWTIVRPRQGAWHESERARARARARKSLKIRWLLKMYKMLECERMYGEVCWRVGYSHMYF